MNSARSNAPFGALGFPIRPPPDHRLVGTSPRFSPPPKALIRPWHLGIPPPPLRAYLPQSLVLTPTSRRVLSKLETKVQAQGSSPYGPQLLYCCTSRVPHLPCLPVGLGQRLEDAGQHP